VGIIYFTSSKNGKGFFMNIFKNGIANVIALLFTLFGLFNVCANADLRQAILDGINKDRITRGKVPLNAHSIVNVKRLSNTFGAFSNAIYEVEFTHKKPIICKQFKDEGQFKGEVQCFSCLRDYFKTSNEWRFSWLAPHFVKYKGYTEYIDENNQIQKLMLLEKARGTILWRLIEDHVLQKQHYSWWREVGCRLAEFHLEYGEVKGNTYVSRTHGDLSVCNIFVDGFTLNFIDYATYVHSLLLKEDISTDLKIFFGKGYKFFTGEYIELIRDQVYRLVNSFEGAVQVLNDVAERIQSVFSEIMQGYIDTFSRSGLNINIDENGQAILTPHLVVKRNLKLAPISQIATKASFIQAIEKKQNPAPKVAPKPAPKVVRKPAPKVVRKPAPKVAPKPAPKVVPKPAPKVAPKPAPKVVPKPAPKVVRKPAPKVVPKPAPKVAPKPAPKVVPKPAPKVVRKPAPKVVRKPAPKVVRKPAPKVVRKPAPKVAPKPAPKVVRKPAPKVVRKPAPKVGPKPAPKVVPKPAPKVGPKPAPKVAPKPAPKVAPKPAPKIAPKPAPKVGLKPAPKVMPKLMQKKLLFLRRLLL
jgi:tRNA A-37 threonylcarbamoyl transferase component Bud32